MNPSMLDLPDKRSALPLYQQIKEQILGQIRSRRWQPGTRLPSENELVEQLEVSRMTVHRALRELTQNGHLERVHGLGTFVAKPRRHASLITLRDIADEIRATGSRHRCQVIGLYRTRADSRQCGTMECPAGTELFHLQAVHFQDDIAIQFEDRLVNGELAPAFLEQDFSSRTATDYLLSLYRPERMEHEVRAVLPDEAIARHLMIGSADPCLALHRRTWFNGQVVTHVTLTYPGSRYALAESYRTADYPSYPETKSRQDPKPAH